MAVEKIVQRGGRVTVTAGGRDFTADACICTVPARVLNKIAFDPPLPAAQRAAAEKLQYARIVKNQILFNERFWGAEDFSLVSDVTSHYYFHSTKDQPGKQGILCSYAIGEKADVLASQSSGVAATSSPAIFCRSIRGRRSWLRIFSRWPGNATPTRRALTRFTGRGNGLRSVQFCSSHTERFCSPASTWRTGRDSWKERL